MAYAGGFGEYLAIKRSKIQNQNAQILSNQSLPLIFQGLTLYFNGYTALTMIEFKELVIQRGAIVKDYLASDTTHIIADQMTDAKIRQLTKPVVKSDWLHQSIDQNVLLPWTNYRLYSGVDPRQKSLENHFTKTATHTVIQSDAAPALEGLDLSNDFIRANIATAPGFLDRYFSSSRLHHLSTWKSDLKDFVVQNFVKKSTLPRKNVQKIIMHVDMDCFFASVATRDRPDLKNAPVAIAHGTGTTNASTSEIASCNYAARAFGIKNGMMLGKARDLCSHLVTLPYEFEKYDACSKDLYRILMKHADDIQAVSCDEAYLEVSSFISESRSVESFAESIRSQIYDTTQCQASIGIGPNMLLARLATSKAKPNGIFHLKGDQAAVFLENQSIGALVGVGWSLVSKLETRGIKTCGQLQKLSLSSLQKEHGQRTGEMLYKFCRGIDDRALENKGRQSLGAEVNWGVRFQNQDQIKVFFRDFCNHIAKRLKDAHVHGRHITIKAKKRLYKGEPSKLLGCGHCENLSKSFLLSQSSNDAEVLFKQGYPLLCAMNISPTYLRGVGIHVSKLEATIMLPGKKRKTGLEVFSPSKHAKVFDKSPNKTGSRQGPLDRFLSPRKSNELKNGIILSEIDPDTFYELPADIQQEIRGQAPENTFVTPKPKSKMIALKQDKIDRSVFEDLPSSIQRELKSSSLYFVSSSPELVSNPLPNHVETNKSIIRSNDETSLLSGDIDQSVFQALPSSIQKELRASKAVPKQDSQQKELDMDTLMPSLSQMDPTVLDALPESIRREILRDVKKTKRSHESAFGVKIRGGSFTNISKFQPENRMPFEPYRLPGLGGETDPLAICEMLDDWIASERGQPNPRGLSELEEYLCALVNDGELELAWKMLLHMDSKLHPSSLKGKRNKAWTDAYLNLYESINELVYEKCGCRFKRFH